MRKKISILTLALVGFGFSALSAPITPAEALQRVKGSNSKKMNAAIAQQTKLAYTLDTEKGTPAVYVFNQGSEAGYIFLSADDVAIPVLGYVDNGVFDADNMSPQLKWWLSEYARQIEYARENNIELASAETAGEMKAIAPLVSSRWNQDAPYNLQCPTDPSTKQQSVTGCVATAMAQAMNFWKYPEVGTGSVSYTPSGFSTKLTMNFASQKFDWGNMLDRYIAGNYNDTQAAAVAYLMKACGYSVQMGYKSTASGAHSTAVGTALMNYFGYNKNISYEQRDYYTISEWNQMVYNELAAGRPVLYAGQSDGGGHEYVCDGYSDGFFHINWGWGGMSDGYFKLDALNPGSEGIGGGSGGFNYMQDILIGVQPKETEVLSKNLLLQCGNLSATVSGLKVTPKITATRNAGVWNWGYNPINVTAAFEISSVENPESKSYETVFSYTLSSQRGYTSINSFSFPSTLADGKYKCTLVNKNNAVTNSPWIPVRCQVGNYNYFYIAKKGTTLSVENETAASLKLTEASLEGDLYYECVANLSATFNNTADVELDEQVVPVILNSSNRIILRGDATGVSVMPGETKTYTFSTIFSLESGASKPSNNTSGTLKFINKTTGAYYGASVPVTIKVNSGTVSAQIQNFKIVDAKQTTVNGVSLVWLVSDPEKISVSFKIRGSFNGYFGYPVYVYITPYGSNSITQMSYVPDTGVGYLESKTVKPTISFAEAVPETLYNIGVLFRGTNNGQTAYWVLNTATMVVRQASGVDETEIESDEPIEYFDLQGRKIENPSKGIYIKRQGSKVEKVVLTN